MTHSHSPDSSQPPCAVDESSGVIAVDPESRKLLVLAKRVAMNNVTVMICGESGVGKEVMARYIHENSKYARGSFVAINCAAIPENMLEATLFGYEKGAFTGAHQASPGKFEQAQGGTLLLDEISEMALDLQAKLLRVLQEREVERLGGRKIISLNVRVLTTSNRDMKAEVAAGRFREDLFFRLSVFPLLIPPLRKRSRDILPLASIILKSFAASNGVIIPALTKRAEKLLLKHAWPGNVRELNNVLQRAMILKDAKARKIDVGDLQIECYDSSVATVFSTKVDDLKQLNENLKEHEHDLIIRALREAMGDRSVVAKKLGISPRTLRYKLAKMRERGMVV
ncbi:MAG: sigma-54 dependent transcriptional regulator [Gammaproteobacteria bacterium]|nr:sigma-54 dependent transcriptional regulator [Gammaproteobacteria bacterium]